MGAARERAEAAGGARDTRSRGDEASRAFGSSSVSGSGSDGRSGGGGGSAVALVEGRARGGAGDDYEVRVVCGSECGR